MDLGSVFTAISTCIPKLAKDSLTERDGQSYCLVRIIALFAATISVVAMSLATLKFWHQSSPSFSDFATMLGAFATSIGSICAVIAWKNRGEKDDV